MRRNLSAQPRDTWTALIVKLPYHLLEETLVLVGESGEFSDEEVLEGLHAAVGVCLEQLVDVPVGLAELIELPGGFPDLATRQALANASKGALCAAAVAIGRQMMDELCDDTSDPVLALAVACHAFEISCRYCHLGPTAGRLEVDLEEIQLNLDRWVSWCEEANTRLALDDSLYVPVRRKPHWEYSFDDTNPWVVCEPEKAEARWDLRHAVVVSE